MNIPISDMIPAMDEATVNSAPRSRAKLATRGKVICPAAPFVRLIKMRTMNFHVHNEAFEFGVFSCTARFPPPLDLSFIMLFIWSSFSRLSDDGLMCLSVHITGLLYHL